MRVLAEIATRVGTQPLIHVALDDMRAAVIADALAFFAPHCEVLAFPAWDCLPYDRISPHTDIVSERIATLTRLQQPFKNRRSFSPPSMPLCRKPFRPTPCGRQACKPPLAMNCRWKNCASIWPPMAMSAPAPCASRVNSPCVAALSIFIRRVTDRLYDWIFSAMKSNPFECSMRWHKPPPRKSAAFISDRFRKCCSMSALLPISAPVTANYSAQ